MHKQANRDQMYLVVHLPAYTTPTSISSAMGLDHPDECAEQTIQVRWVPLVLVIEVRPACLDSPLS